MSSDDDWVTVEGVRYVPEAPLRAEIDRLRAEVEKLQKRLTEADARSFANLSLALTPTRDKVRKALARLAKASSRR